MTGIWKHGLLLSARGNPGGVVGDAKSALVRGARDAQAGTGRDSGAVRARRRLPGHRRDARGGSPPAAEQSLEGKPFGPSPRGAAAAATPRRRASPGSCCFHLGRGRLRRLALLLPHPGAAVGRSPLSLGGSRGSHSAEPSRAGTLPRRGRGVRGPRSRPARRVPAPSPCRRCRWLYPRSPVRGRRLLARR